MADTGLSATLHASYEQFTLEAEITVTQGELACIIGPSGCGKSTTLQLLAGLLPTKESSILLNGRDLSNVAVHQREIALVFQEYALFPHMDVAHNIAYPLKLRKLSKAQQRKRVTELLELVSLTGYERRRTDELSGGERQRVALARALASDPKLLLLDEPLSALDAKLRKHLREEIKRIHDETGITTLYVTHDQEEALSIGDRIIVMNEGKVMQSGTPQEIYREPQSLFVASFIGESNVIDRNLLPNALPFAKDGETLFFRPAHVTVHDGRQIAAGEYLPHIAFEGAQVKTISFQGDHYRLFCSWNDQIITCYSDQRPSSDTVDLSVRIRDIRRFPTTKV
jgi:ABC-type Fe3+/spermidine/putrescine transport system ATPase subunit